MLKVVIFLTTAALLALGIAWFADRPGNVSVTWLGYRIETSILVAIFAVALLASYLPARRAASVSPVEAMRGD